MSRSPADRGRAPGARQSVAVRAGTCVTIDERPTVSTSKDAGGGTADTAWRRRPAVRYGVAWLATRSLAFVFINMRIPRADVWYYGDSVGKLLHGDLTIAQTMPEYPLPAVGIVFALRFLTGDRWFPIGFCLAMLALDGAFSGLLWRRRDGAGHSRALAFWLLFGVFAGPFLCARLDTVSAVLAGASLVLASGASVRVAGSVGSGALLGIGSALKYWPALLLPAAMRSRFQARPALAMALVAGSLTLASAVGGIGRVLSPLHWQAGRGLHVESVLATPLLISAMFRTGRYSVEFSRYQAWEVSGPGTPAVLAATTAVAVVPIFLVVVLWVRGYRAASSIEAQLWSAVAVVLVLIVSNKVFSPQYLLWAGAVVAALLTVAHRDAASNRLTRVVLWATGLTMLECPFLYGSVLALNPAATGIVVARNLLVLYACVFAVREAWRRSAP